MKSFFISIAVLFTSSLVLAGGPPSVLLELRESDGTGRVFKDIAIVSTGAVYKTQDGTTATIGQLDSADLRTISAEVAVIRPVQLVRTNPNQKFNPGGFVHDYNLTLTDGKTFEFARNYSGVDYGLPGTDVGDQLRAILDSFDQL